MMEVIGRITLLWSLVSMFIDSSHQNEEVPRFWILPDSEIFEDELLKEVRIQVDLSPENATLGMGILSLGSRMEDDQIISLTFTSSSSTMSLDKTRVQVESREKTGSLQNLRERWSLRIVRIESILGKTLHLLATNDLSTVTSRPFRIIRKVLNPFPLVHHESVEFLMGNVGQVVCMIPLSKPSPPDIEFLHDDVRINVTKGGRFKKVFLNPDFMVLLIKNLVLEDQGSYSCIASLPGFKTFQRSDKVTRLKVQEPKRNMRPRFRVSSRDTDPGTSRGQIQVPEGLNLTLFCLFESAPISEVSWYWPNPIKKYEVDVPFGTLFIPNIQKDDASEFSCSVDDVIGRTFILKVVEHTRFTSSPFEISFQVFKNKPVQITCKIQTERSKGSIKWFHNGQVLKENKKKIKILRNTLLINGLKEEHLGIYQCWLENDGNSWATGVTVIRKRGKINEGIDSQEESASMIEKETAPGLTIHFECSLSKSQMEKITDFTVKWYRQTNSLEPIDLISNKYVMFNKKSERKVILSIVNPTKNHDEGIYICRLYDSNSNLLRTMTFKLRIYDPKPNEPVPVDPNQMKSFSKNSLIEVPEVSKVNEFFLAVHLSWKISVQENGALFQIYHYRIQYQRKHFQTLQKKNGDDDQSLSEGWSQEKMMDQYTTRTEITVLLRHIFRPYCQMRFRVLAIPKISSPIPSLRGLNRTMMDDLSSGWSNAVEFTKILPCRLTISTNNAKTPTLVEVMWTHTCVQDPEWSTIVFNLIYASMTECLRSKICPSDRNTNSFESILVRPEFQSMRRTIRIDRDFGEFFQMNLTRLKPNTEYIMGMYAAISSKSKEEFFISLSNIVDVSTTKIFKSTLKIHDNPHIISSAINDAKNRVIFLVLGSLAGVLFVTAVVMFGMCMWYYMKKHVKKHKAQPTPRNPHQNALFFRYPPSSIPSPIYYGSRINPMISYQSTLSKYFISSKYDTPYGPKHQKLCPVNVLNHHSKTLPITDKFSEGLDSDLDSMCNSDKIATRIIRRNVLMGVDQASSTYSRVACERSLSLGLLNTISAESPPNFQNMTLPRQCVIPISFPKPPPEPHKDYLENTLLYHCGLEKEGGSDPRRIIEENCSSIPFLDKPFRHLCNGSVHSVTRMDFTTASRSKYLSETFWILKIKDDPSSTSQTSTGNENNQDVQNQKIQV